MESQPVLETLNVVIAPPVGVRIGRVDADAEVGAQHQVADVVAQAESRAEGDLVPESPPLEFGARPQGVVLQQPDVARIEEQSAVEASHDAEAEFDVGLELEVARLIQVAVAIARGRTVASRADRPHGEGADAVGAADVELLAVGHHLGVAVGIPHPHEKARGQPVVAASEAVKDLHLAHVADELRKAVAEQMLRLPLAAQAQHARQQVACGRKAVLPVEAAAGGRTVAPVEGIGIPHRRDELVAEAQRNGRIGLERLVERLGRMQQPVVDKTEDREGVAARRRGAEVVAGRATEGDQAEIVGTVHQVQSQLERGLARRGQTFRQAAEGQQARHVERRVEPQLVGVEPRGAAAGVLVARLPLVGAVERDGEDLAATEEVVVGHLQRDARPEKAVRLGGHVGFERDRDRIVELRVDAHVYLPAAAQRIERRHAHAHRAEDAELAQFVERAVLRIDREELAAPERQRPGQHPRAEFQRPLGHNLGIAQPQRVGRSGLDVAQGDGNPAHAVGFERRGGHVGLEHEPQIDTPRRKGRVGEVFEVLGTEVVVAAVAQLRGDAAALLRERIEVVLRPGTQQRRCLQAVEERAERPLGLRIGDPRIGIGRRDVQRVVHAGLAAVLAVAEAACGLRAEMAVVLERLHRHAGPQLGLHGRQQHGLLGQPLVEPVAESLFARRIAIVVGPQSDRKRGAQVGTVEGVVRRHVEGLAGRGLGRRGEHDARIRLDADPVHARIEDLALAQAARRGAGAEQQRRSQHKAANGMSQRIHCLSVVFRAGVSSAGRGP